MPPAVSPPRQASLLGDLQRRERPWKRMRAVSKHQYAQLRDTDRLQQRQHDFLTALAAYTNRWGVAPTVAELAEWAHADGRLPRPDPNLYRPRATELSKGERRRGRPTKGGGVIELLPRRRCRVTGRAAHPLRIIEAGAEVPR